MSGVRMERVSKRFGRGEPWVLREVDLHVPQSCVVRIEGPNGQGKSTLLRLLAGIGRPSAGRVTGRVRTGYVPERFPPGLPYDPVGYLRQLGRVHGLSGAQAARRAETWVERMGLAEHAHVPLRRVSKGTAQKVAVAQALMAGPELLVLDEAYTGLDRQVRTRLDEAVVELAREGGRVVLVDHDPRRLAGCVTGVHRLEGGRLVARSPAEPEPDTPMLIRVENPEGAYLGDDLPGAPRVQASDASTVVLTVGSRDSDALLRTLLDVRPALRVRSVAEAGTTWGEGES